MGKIKTFEELAAWQHAGALLKELKADVFCEPLKKDFRLAAQLRDCADSIMANIAEGFERGTPKEFRQFLSIAKGSCGELQSHLYSAHDFGYMRPERFNYLLLKAKEVGRLRRAVNNRVISSS